MPGVDGRFQTPADVRDWLDRIARDPVRLFMTDHGLDLAVIGNGRTAALLEPSGRLVWWCYPRFDGDPVFCRLVAGDEEKGLFRRRARRHGRPTSREYLRNTAIVATVLTDSQGGAVRITDFAPRFRNYGRMYRAAAADPDHRAGGGPAAHHHSHAPDAQLRRSR